MNLSVGRCRLDDIADAYASYERNAHMDAECPLPGWSDPRAAFGFMALNVSLTRL